MKYLDFLKNKYELIFSYLDSLTFGCTYQYFYKFKYFILYSNEDPDEFKDFFRMINILFQLNAINGIRNFAYGIVLHPFFFFESLRQLTMAFFTVPCWIFGISFYFISDLIFVNFCHLILRPVWRLFIRIPKHFIIYIFIYFICFFNVFLIFKIYFFIIYINLIKFSFLILWVMFSFFCFILFFSYLFNILSLIYFLMMIFFISLVFLLNLSIYINSSFDSLILSTSIYFFNILYTYMIWEGIFDKYVLIMCILIFIVSFCVYFYSVLYMRYDPYLFRFLYLLSLFIFFMLFFVISLNIIQLFLGWEGIGLCSYLLINFWFTRISANQAALKAMILNKIGDLSFLVFIILYYYIYRSFDYIFMFIYINYYKYVYLYIFGFNFHLYSLLAFFLLIAIMAKSAQLGLHMWLPDAMEGPTPVSALIHAATMVTAGIYLYLRLYLFFEYSLLNIYILYLGSLTALFGSLVASFQYDIKKIIAYSTCSQLGYMLVACGITRYDFAIFHLFNHGFFKALLFLLAGILIHVLLNEQDMRRMGLLYLNFPITLSFFFIGLYSLLGLPYFSGFYSKELILNNSFSIYNINYYIIYSFILCATFFTAYYSYRLVYYVFFSSVKQNIFFIQCFEELKLLFFLSILICFSFYGGFFFNESINGIGNYEVYKIFGFKNIFYEYEYLYFIYKLIPVFISFIGLIVGYYLIIKKNRILYIFNYKSYKFFNQKWYFDILSYFYFSKIILKKSYLIFKVFDKNFFELYGSFGFSYSLNYFFFLYKSFYNAYLISYINLFFLGLYILGFSFFFEFFWVFIISIFIIIYFIFTYD